MKPSREQLSQYGGVLYTVFIALFVLGLVYFFFIPKYDEIKMLQDTIVQQTKELEETRTYLAYLTELAQSTLGIEQSIIDYAIPSDNDVVSLMVTYEGLSKFPDVNVSPLDISPGLVSSEKIDENKSSDQKGKEQPIEPKSFDFTTQAESNNEKNMHDFIHEIYQARRFLTIKSMTLNRDDVKAAFALSLNLSAYYLPPFTVQPSPDLVKKGKDQSAFFEELKNTKLYDQLILDSVGVGKTDLFNFE